jgi:hypothetical protein
MRWIILFLGLSCFPHDTYGGVLLMDEIIETGELVSLSHRNYSGGVQIVTVTAGRGVVAETIEVDMNEWRPLPPGGDPGSCSYHLKNGSFILVRMNARRAGRVRIHVETLPYTIAFTEPDDPGLNYSGKKIEESEEGAP